MGRIALIVGGFVFLFLCPNSGAYGEQPIHGKDAAALELLAQAEEKMGAKRMLPNDAGQVTLVASGEYVQSSERGTSTLPLTIKVLGFKQVRWEVDTAEGKVVTVIRGDGGWTKSGKGTRALPVADTIGRRLELFPFLAVTSWITEPEVVLQSIEAESLSGKTHSRIAISRTILDTRLPQLKNVLERTSRCELLVDRETNLPSRLRYSEHARDWRVSIPVELVYGNYQTFGGVYIPLTITRNVYGQKVGEIHLRSVSFNAAVDPSEFIAR